VNRWEWRVLIQPHPDYHLFFILLAIVGAFLLGGIIMAITGHDPYSIYSQMFKGVFGSRYGLAETTVKAIPLIITGLGIALAFRLRIWNIGGEGQLYMGAFAATFIVLCFPCLPSQIVLPSMFLAGLIAGGLWALLPAIPRVLWGVNEILTTLMLNYVAISWVDYLVYGPWKDPAGYNFPLTPLFPSIATLPVIGNTRIHNGLHLALILVLLFHVLYKYSRWGYEARITGESVDAAHYAGINVRRQILISMFLSGALCGLAGMTEVSGITHRLQHGISPGYGYTAIIVAWLARLHPLAIVPVAFLFAALQVGGYLVQTTGVPAAVAGMLQGIILFFVLGGEMLSQYRFRKI